MANKIIDYISGLEIIATPEEVEATQPFSKILVEDYRYPKEFIQTRPQFKVKSRPSDNIKEYPVDIAVFDSENHTDSNISIVAECKKKNRKDGKTQLESYLTLSNAKCGVWFNGEEKLFIRKIIENGGIKFVEIPNIPRFGERLEDVGRFRRRDLQDTHNLKSIFKTIRNYLAANAIGATTDDVLAQQLINIIFCKIYDERFTPLDDLVSFRAGLDEDISKIKERILQIFTNVKIKYKEVITNEDNITLDDKSIAYIVGELQNYCLIDAERDVIADAFEVFIGHALKGDKGQFFTPRNVIKLMIEIIQPTENDIIIDSACGSGGFLIEALRYVWKKIKDDRERIGGWSESAIIEEQKEFAMNKIHGLEKDKFLVKLTKAYMAILGDGKGGVFCEDSLDNPNYWSDETKVKIQMNSHSIVLTNPPFGTSINVLGADKLRQYEFGYKWGKDYNKTNKLKDKENPQVLFIERNLQLLKDGGKIGIVLPETYLHGPSVKYIIKHLEKKHNIFAVIDLPHNTFRPHCNAKCCVLFLQKNTKQQENITMGIVEEMGHNHQGKEIYRFDNETNTLTNDIWDDTLNVIEEFKDPSNTNNNYVFLVNKNDIVNSLYVPRYYWNKNVSNIKDEANKNYTLIPINQLLKEGIISQYKGHGAPPSAFKGRGEVFYVRAGDIMNWDIFKNPTSSVPMDIYIKGTQGKGKVKLQEKDILFVKEGSYRVGDVAMLSPADTNIFLNHHTLVFRVNNENNKYGIDAYYLLYLLSHNITTKQFFNKVMFDTTLPNIGDRWKELLLPIDNNPIEREKIKKELKEAFNKRWNTQKDFDKIKEKLKQVS